MKSKLIKDLLAVLNGVKESQGDVTLDLNTENKESVYSELLIPLMNLTNSDSIEQLHTKLEFLVNGDSATDEHTEMCETLVKFILDDEDSDSNFSETLNSVIINCVAVLNTFNEMKESTDKKESVFTDMDTEIVAIINTQKIETNNEEGTTDLVEDSKNEAGGDPATKEEEEPVVPAEPEVEEEETGGPTLTIIAAADEVDETPWNEVNKVELKNVLMEALSASDDNKAVIDEVFALVKSYDKVGDQQWPHHVVKESNVVLNVNGLKTAALFLLKPNASKNLTTDERTAIASHLLRHYDELKMEKPEKLSKVAEGKESCVVINIKDDELQEFGEMFQVNAESIGTYVGLLESMLTDFVNGGIINIESEDKDFDESMVTIKLNKAQTEEFIKYFDILSDDIVSILAGDFDSLSYKQTDSNISDKLQESSSHINTLETTIAQLNTTIEDQKAQLTELVNTTVDQHLTQTKFQAIIDFIKSSDGVDETVIQFINNVIEAENDNEIQYMAKIGKSFMKSSANSEMTKFVKKSSIISKFNTADVTELLGLTGTKNESAVPKTVNEKIDRLSDYL